MQAYPACEAEMLYPVLDVQCTLCVSCNKSWRLSLLNREEIKLSSTSNTLFLVDASAVHNVASAKIPNDSVGIRTALNSTHAGACGYVASSLGSGRI